MSATIRVKLEDYKRLLKMRTPKLKFIGDVITYLIDFYDENQSMEEKVN